VDGGRRAAWRTPRDQADDPRQGTAAQLDTAKREKDEGDLAALSGSGDLLMRS
jgi:hypothetical protein